MRATEIKQVEASSPQKKALKLLRDGIPTISSKTINNHLKSISIAEAEKILQALPQQITQYEDELLKLGLGQAKRFTIEIEDKTSKKNEKNSKNKKATLTRKYNFSIGYNELVVEKKKSGYFLILESSAEQQGNIKLKGMQTNALGVYFQEDSQNATLDTESKPKLKLGTMKVTSRVENLKYLENREETSQVSETVPIDQQVKPNQTSDITVSHFEESVCFKRICLLSEATLLPKHRQDDLIFARNKNGFITLVLPSGDEIKIKEDESKCLSGFLTTQGVRETKHIPATNYPRLNRWFKGEGFLHKRKVIYNLAPNFEWSSVADFFNSLKSKNNASFKTIEMEDIIFIVSQILVELTETNGAKNSELESKTSLAFHGGVAPDKFLLLKSNVLKLLGRSETEAKTEPNLYLSSPERILTAYEDYLKTHPKKTFSEFVYDFRLRHGHTCSDTSLPPHIQYLSDELVKAKGKNIPHDEEKKSDLDHLKKLLPDEKKAFSTQLGDSFLPCHGSHTDDIFSLGIIVSELSRHLNTAHCKTRFSSPKIVEVYQLFMAFLNFFAKNGKETLAVPGHLLSFKPKDRMTLEAVLDYMQDFLIIVWPKLKKFVTQPTISHFEKNYPKLKWARLIREFDEMDHYFFEEKNNNPELDEAYKDWMLFLQFLFDGINSNTINADNYSKTIADYLQPAHQRFKNNKSDFYAEMLSKFTRLFSGKSLDKLNLSWDEIKQYLMPELNHHLKCYRARLFLAMHIRGSINKFRLDVGSSGIPRQAYAAAEAFVEYDKSLQDFQSYRKTLPLPNILQPDTFGQPQQVLKQLATNYNKNRFLSEHELNNLTSSVVATATAIASNGSKEVKEKKFYVRRKKVYKFCLNYGMSSEQILWKPTEDKNDSKEQGSTTDTKAMSDNSFSDKLRLLINKINLYFYRQRKEGKFNKRNIEERAHWIRVCQKLKKNQGLEVEVLKKLIDEAPSSFMNREYQNLLNELEETLFSSKNNDKEKNLPKDINEYIEKKSNGLEFFKECCVYFRQREIEDSRYYKLPGEFYSKDLLEKSQHFLMLIMKILQILKDFDDPTENKKTKILRLLDRAINTSADRYQLTLNHLKKTFQYDLINIDNKDQQNKLVNYLEKIIKENQDFFLRPFLEVDEYLSQREAETGSSYRESAYSRDDFDQRADSYLQFLTKLRESFEINKTFSEYTHISIGSYIPDKCKAGILYLTVDNNNQIITVQAANREAKKFNIEGEFKQLNQLPGTEKIFEKVSSKSCDQKESADLFKKGSFYRGEIPLQIAHKKLLLACGCTDFTQKAVVDIKDQANHFRKFGTGNFSKKMQTLASYFERNEIFPEQFLKDYLDDQILYYQSVVPFSIYKAIDNLENVINSRNNLPISLSLLWERLLNFFEYQSKQKKLGDFGGSRAQVDINAFINDCLESNKEDAALLKALGDLSKAIEKESPSAPEITTLVSRDDKNNNDGDDDDDGSVFNLFTPTTPRFQEEEKKEEEKCSINPEVIIRYKNFLQKKKAYFDVEREIICFFQKNQLKSNSQTINPAVLTQLSHLVQSFLNKFKEYSDFRKKFNIPCFNQVKEGDAALCDSIGNGVLNRAFEQEYSKVLICDSFPEVLEAGILYLQKGKNQLINVKAVGLKDKTLNPEKSEELLGLLDKEKEYFELSKTNIEDPAIVIQIASICYFSTCSPPVGVGGVSKPTLNPEYSKVLICDSVPEVLEASVLYIIMGQYRPVRFIALGIENNILKSESSEEIFGLLEKSTHELKLVNRIASVCDCVSPCNTPNKNRQATKILWQMLKKVEIQSTRPMLPTGLDQKEKTKTKELRKSSIPPPPVPLRDIEEGKNLGPQFFSGGDNNGRLIPVRLEKKSSSNKVDESGSDLDKAADLAYENLPVNYHENMKGILEKAKAEVEALPKTFCYWFFGSQKKDGDQLEIIQEFMAYHLTRPVSNEFPYATEAQIIYLLKGKKITSNILYQAFIECLCYGRNIQIDCLKMLVYELQHRIREDQISERILSMDQNKQENFRKMKVLQRDLEVKITEQMNSTQALTFKEMDEMFKEVRQCLDSIPRRAASYYANVIQPDNMRIAYDVFNQFMKGPNTKNQETQKMENVYN